MINKEDDNKIMDKDKPNKKNIKDKKAREGVKIKKFDDLEGKFLHVRVGTKDQPATTKQIQEIENKIIGLFNKSDINCLIFVTHHAVSMDIIKRDSNNVGK